MKMPILNVSLENPVSDPTILPMKDVGYGAIAQIVEAYYVHAINQQGNGSGGGWYAMGPEMILPIGVSEAAARMDSFDLYDEEKTMVRLLMPTEKLVITQSF